MKFLICLFAVSVASTLACDSPPNNTEPSERYLKAIEIIANKPVKSHVLKDVIQVVAMTVTDDKGSPNYPIDVHKPIVLHTKSTLSGTTSYKMLWEDVKVSGWNFLGRCGWSTIPTLGLLNNLKQCGNCPLHPGPLVLDYSIDLTPYATIISLLTDGGVYQLEVHMKSSDAPHPELGCVTVQMKIGKK